MAAPIAFEMIDGTLHCIFAGRLDTAVSAAVDADLQAQLTDTGRPVVFDLAQVDYVSSAFLRLCVATAKRVPAFSIVKVDPSVKRVFKIAGFEKLMRIE